MSLTPTVQTVKGRPGPLRALEFNCVGRWNGADDAILISLQGQLKLSDSDTVLSEPVMLDRVQWPDSSNPFLKRDRDASVLFTISAPLSAAAISFIEHQRKGADVRLRLEIWYQWQEGRRQQAEVTNVGPVFWPKTSTIETIPHSEWIKRLSEMQWAEYELFEVAVLVLENDPNLVESLRVLRTAKKKLREGDYAGVLVDCRMAFASAAKYAAEGGELKTGFDALLAQGFPEHPEKPPTLNGFIKAFSDYLHLARHGQYPAIRFTRAEAQFVFATTVSFFSLLSRRLGKLETVD